MKKLYYVEAVIEKTVYMQDSVKIDYRNCIWADTEDEAFMILERYWDNKNDPYSVSYFVSDWDIKETLES